MAGNLATILTESAERNGDGTALKLDDAELSYSMLDGASTHVVGLLREKGFEPGDRVGIMLPNVPYFAVVYYGVLRAGGVVVPMNVLLKGREVEFYLEDSGRQARLRLARLRRGRREGRGRRGCRGHPGQARRVRAAGGRRRARLATWSTARATTPRSSSTRRALPASQRAPS